VRLYKSEDQNDTINFILGSVALP